MRLMADKSLQGGSVSISWTRRAASWLMLVVRIHEMTSVGCCDRWHCGAIHLFISDTMAHLRPSFSPNSVEMLQVNSNISNHLDYVMKKAHCTCIPSVFVVARLLNVVRILNGERHQSRARGVIALGVRLFYRYPTMPRPTSSDPFRGAVQWSATRRDTGARPRQPRTYQLLPSPHLRATRVSYPALGVLTTGLDIRTEVIPRLAPGTSLPMVSR
jgi:hypothetical protein